MAAQSRAGESQGGLPEEAALGSAAERAVTSRSRLRWLHVTAGAQWILLIPLGQSQLPACSTSCHPQTSAQPCILTSWAMSFGVPLLSKALALAGRSKVLHGASLVILHPPNPTTRP